MPKNVSCSAICTPVPERNLGGDEPPVKRVEIAKPQAELARRLGCLHSCERVLKAALAELSLKFIDRVTNKLEQRLFVTSQASYLNPSFELLSRLLCGAAMKLS